MRAAQIAGIGGSPELAEIEEPAAGHGEALVEIAAVALNPLDINVAAGRFYGGHPPVPYIPGCEGVGRVLEADSLEAGAPVYLFGQGIGLARNGTLAKVVAVPAETAVPLPEGLDDGLAVACGIAGIPGWTAVALAEVGADDCVVVLGATGTVGSVAVQAARLRGARRIVAVGRRAEALVRTTDMGAHATVVLGEGDLDAFGAELADACGEGGATVIVDPLWGRPLEGALAAAAPGARIVHLGQSAGPTAELPSASVRGKQLHIRGLSVFGFPREELRLRYLELVERVAGGDIAIDLETSPLDGIAEAWRRQAEGGAAKQVVKL